MIQRIQFDSRLGIWLARPLSACQGTIHDKLVVAHRPGYDGPGGDRFAENAHTIGSQSLFGILQINHVHDYIACAQLGQPRSSAITTS